MTKHQVCAPGCNAVPALYLSIAALLFLMPLQVSANTLIFETNDSNASEGSSYYSAPPKKVNNAYYSSAPKTKNNAYTQGAAPVAKAQPVVVAQPASANSELFFMIEELQGEIKALRGQLEEQSNEIRHLKRNAKARYLDLDSRLSSLTKRLSDQPQSGKQESLPLDTDNAKSSVKPDTGSEKQTEAKPLDAVSKVASQKVSAAEKSAYEKAYSLIKQKRFDEAVVSFYEFIEKYPDGSLAGNAYYWLGEVYLVQPKLEQARQAFSIVVQAYPEHGKVADSLFKLGVAYDRLQNPTESQKYLSEVQKRFPNSTAAKLAKSYKINR